MERMILAGVLLVSAVMAIYYLAQDHTSHRTLIEQYTRSAYDCGMANDEAARAAACRQRVDYKRRLKARGINPERSVPGALRPRSGL